MRTRRLISALFLIALTATAAVQTPEQYFGFRIGSDKKLVRWDKIVEYMQAVANGTDRVRFRNLGPTTNGNPFVLLEISSAENLRNLDKLKNLERKLYFQGGAPTDAERDEIFRSGKAVVFITNNIHSTEIGASQMVLELVHNLATSDSPAVKKVLDNVILLLVPSLNPDGQIMVTDWYNKTLGTPSEASPLPYLYHNYTGHDNNRDMYLFSQKESQMAAQVLWHEWFPSIWLDEHQQGTSGPRIFTMPATDPINPNVDPLIYRLNGVFGQSQAAALEAEGKTGIIFNSTYTNFWQGAMAWAGWWHNQVGLLTEVASARIATPVVQLKADPTRAASTSAPATAPATGGRGGGAGAPTGTNAAPSDFESERRRAFEHPDDPLPAPRDITPRTEYPRPWLGGRWTLRDIVDYELIATNALLETAADSRETLLRQIYSINRNTIEAGKKGELGQDKDKTFAILIPADGQHDANEAIELVDKLLIAGVEVFRAQQGFKQDDKTYPAGTFVIPFNQVFARYAKDLLEKQTYPEVRRSPGAPAEAPYDVSAWSLGMQFGVKTEFAKTPLATFPMDKVAATPRFVLSATQRRRRLALPLQRRALRHGGQPPAERRRQGESDQTRGGLCALRHRYREARCLEQGRGRHRRAPRSQSSRQDAAGHHAQRAARRHLPVLRPLDGRGLDPLGAGSLPVRIHQAAQRGHQAGQTTPALRRHHPARPAHQLHARWPRLQGHRRRVSRRAR